MDLITTAAAVYPVPETAVVYPTTAWMGTERGIAAPVPLVQYDNTLPILAVALYLNGQPYTLPEGAAVNIRMDKRDGHYVYNPALGVSEDRQTAYIGVTLQMTTGAGCFAPALEIVVNGEVAGTSNIPMVIAANQVPEDAVASTDEFKTVQQLAAQAQAAADAAAASQTAAAGSASEAEKSASAAKTSETNAEESATNAANSASAAATSEGNAANSATSASGYASNAAQSASAAAANAQAAAQSAQEAQTAAQQALGFRTFFSAVSPDENGDLDPSRPMTTPTAQESWTIKSKGDRIQSVQVNGFTTQSGTGDPSPDNVRPISTAGKKFVKIMFDGSSDENWSLSSGSGDGPTGSKRFSIAAEIAASNTSYVQAPKGHCTRLTGNTPNNTYSGYSGENAYSVIQESGKPYIQVRIAHVSTLEDLRRDLAANPITVWYEPADESQATGLYIPIQAQGHEYRCKMLELTEPLCDGDKVESNVPSGCDKTLTIDGSTVTVTASGTDYVVAATDTADDGNVYAEGLAYLSLAAGQIVIPASSFPASVTSAQTANTWLQSNPQKVRYQSTSYTEANDIPVELETHKNGYAAFNGYENWQAWGASAGSGDLMHLKLSIPSNDYYNFLATEFKYISTTNPGGAYLEQGGITTNPTGGQFGDILSGISGDTTLDKWKNYLIKRASDGTPVAIKYPLRAIAVYAHDPVELVAVPYTEVDATAAQQLAATPSTLPYIDSADVPMLLDDTVQPMTLAAPLASALPVAGTYVVSSQDGTTVQVSLKAMQDGGDAATLGGESLEQIKAEFPIIQSGTVQTTTIGPLQNLPIDITFTTPMPDTNYAVSFGVYLGAGYWSVLRCRCTSKRTDGFGLDVRNDVSDGSADPASIDWIAVHQ